MDQFMVEVVRGERGLLTVEDRAARFGTPPMDGVDDRVGRIGSAIRDELNGLASYFESRANRIDQLYRDISMDGEREVRCLREIASVLKARASGDIP